MISSLESGDLAELVQDARRRTLALVADLRDEQLSVPPMEHVNPFLWELGHVAFFWQAFVLHELQGVEDLLEEGDAQLYDSFSVEHDTRWELLLTPRDETLAHMERVLRQVLAITGSSELDERTRYLVQLGLLHEDMHGEAFAYMRQTLGYAPPPSAEGERTAPGGFLDGDVEVAGGRFRLGAERGAPFTFDNEKWSHEVEVAPFQIARAPVTNAAFAAFVEDGGYACKAFWSESGWRWRSRAELDAPVYWRREGTRFLQRCFDRWVPLVEAAPVVHVSWHEARAWCRWAERRLPSEAEWELAAGGMEKRRLPWGDRADEPLARRARLDGFVAGCAEVGACEAGDSPTGCRQMLGNVWEWTASRFMPYPDFKADAPYREYSQPWFGDRLVLRGGSWATRARLASTTYRNFFPAHRNDIFAGFRTCVGKDAS